MDETRLVLQCLNTTKAKDEMKIKITLFFGNRMLSITNKLTSMSFLVSMAPVTTFRPLQGVWNLARRHSSGAQRARPGGHKLSG
jgi:hypothetical protein